MARTGVTRSCHTSASRARLSKSASATLSAIDRLLKGGAGPPPVTPRPPSAAGSSSPGAAAARSAWYRNRRSRRQAPFPCRPPWRVQSMQSPGSHESPDPISGAASPPSRRAPAGSCPSAPDRDALPKPSPRRRRHPPRSEPRGLAARAAGTAGPGSSRHLRPREFSPFRLPRRVPVRFSLVLHRRAAVRRIDHDANRLDQFAAVILALLEDLRGVAMQPLALLLTEIFRGDDDDWDIAPGLLFPHGSQPLEAVHPRHHQVEEQRRRLAPGKLMQSFRTVRRLAHGPARLGQKAPQHLTRSRIVVDDQNIPAAVGPADPGK